MMNAFQITNCSSEEQTDMKGLNALKMVISCLIIFPLYMKILLFQ